MYKDLSEWLTYLESVSYHRSLKVSSSSRAQRFDSFKKITQKLNVLHWDCPVVTVAGTNGKGSCVALLASILKAAGYSVGTYTSPHLLRYNERIQVNLEPVNDYLLCSTFHTIYALKQDAALGYVGYSALAALLLFKATALDVILLEVGVGGRFDFVNSVDSTIAIISSIDFDHTQLLGNSIEEIAFEKAGIMRAGQPAIWGDKQLPANVKQYAQALGTSVWVQEKDFGILRSQDNENVWQWWGLYQKLSKLPIPNITYLPNAACVLQAIAYLKATHLPMTQKSIELGLKNFQLPGRFQIVTNGPTQIILDVAHNPASARLLANNLARLSYSGRLLAVVGMLAKKDTTNILHPLIAIVDHWYLGSLMVPSGATAKDLASPLKANAIMHYSICPTVEDAYIAAVKAAGVGDVIVVFGSFRTIEAITNLTV